LREGDAIRIEVSRTDGRLTVKKVANAGPQVLIANAADGVFSINIANGNNNTDINMTL
jgi:hypothetical protein